ncbi:Smr/MutS family protein [uncultured Roseovarius sp.]|uniref:Smr/MutS family protein n=1 Tax=uncultured Roseovarius sp. TaxID=293344 RepID=UPI002632B65C|nr:Smr/MutS family protein [uncultured Roseovarius sp.]
MSRRKLRPEELDLWRKVADTAQPMHPDRPMPALPLTDKNPPKPTPRPVEKFDLGGRSTGNAPKHDVLPGLPERLAKAPVKMDRKAFGKLKRGKLVPEGKIDLHGKTLDQAHPALTAFILASHAAGKRLVLVVTGKGKDRDDGGPIPVRLGVLRHNVPHWLSVPPLAQVVLQVTEAHLKHGGGGAYYVYLRRHR